MNLVKTKFNFPDTPLSSLLFWKGKQTKTSNFGQISFYLATISTSCGDCFVDRR